MADEQTGTVAVKTATFELNSDGKVVINDSNHTMFLIDNLTVLLEHDLNGKLWELNDTNRNLHWAGGIEAIVKRMSVPAVCRKAAVGKDWIKIQNNLRPKSAGQWPLDGENIKVYVSEGRVALTPPPDPRLKLVADKLDISIDDFVAGVQSCKYKLVTTE